MTDEHIISAASAEATKGAPRVLGRHLTQQYGSAHALRDAEVVARDGESVAIMGPSGSGKTTLLHVLAGVIRPDEGQVQVRTDSGTVELTRQSDEVRSRTRLNEFGFVFQQGLLIPELTAAENVMLPLLLLRVGRGTARDLAHGALHLQGVGGFGERRPGQLSGGQAQRVAIARAIVTGPSVVFADEPTGALDSRTAGHVMDALLESTAGQGRTLVLVTHDEAVASRCARIVRMLDGAIADDGQAVA